MLSGEGCETLVARLWGACLHRLLLGELPLTDEFVRNLLGGVSTDSGG